MPVSPPPVIHWFRRDLRISDNTALHAAQKSGQPVIPVYIVSQWRENHLWTGPKRQKFLCDCLESLAKNLETVEAKLIIRQGSAIAELFRLINETGAKAIYTNADPDPFGKEVEATLKELCTNKGIELHRYDDVSMHAANEVLKGDGNPYRVYTPYSRQWLTRDKTPPLGKVKSLNTPSDIFSEALPSLKTWGLTPEHNSQILVAGERAAHRRLSQALDQRLDNYVATRDIPSFLGTSRLSQDLRLGTISIRQVYAATAKRCKTALPPVQRNLEKYIQELAWRDFYLQILAHYPRVLEEEFNPTWKGLPWDEPGEQFLAWKEGRTGFPIIDAGIRELLQTGFMHNRVRMIVAMFLTKDLHIDWRLGESFFMQHLIDGEIASNNGGWQWSAGTGADAAPYFRIQNPWTQSQRYDPQGLYIKQWLPELKDLPPKKFFKAPSSNESISPHYPSPIVDHSTERNKTLSIFKTHREAQQ